MLRWTGELSLADARALVTRLYNAPDNPARAEVATYTRGRHTKRVGRTPRFAIQLTPRGGVRIGINVDNWSEAALKAERPAEIITDDNPDAADEPEVETR